MPSKTSKKKLAAALPTIPKEIIDQFVSGTMTAETVNAASMAFKKRRRCSNVHWAPQPLLGLRAWRDKPGDTANHRNGVSTVGKPLPAAHTEFLTPLSGFFIAWSRCTYYLFQLYFLVGNVFTCFRVVLQEFQLLWGCFLVLRCRVKVPGTCCRFQLNFFASAFGHDVFP